MAAITTLADAVEELVHDGDRVAIEGFSHLVPFAAGHEVIRQGRRDLTLVRLAPDIVYDQLVGAGCAAKLIFSWAGNPSVGLLPRIRAATEREPAHPIEIEEHSHAGLVAAFAAGAANLPFGVLRGYAGGDLAARSPGVSWIECPFTGERLAAVRAMRPDVGIIHAQQADSAGNVMFWGVAGVQKEAVLASARAIVTVEEIVDRLEPRAGATVLPGWAIDAVAVAPGGAHPSYALGYYDRDDAFYRDWDAISRDDAQFAAWIDRHVRGVPGIDGYFESLSAAERETA
jgi:glutaconate CoA-transferase subunit A